MSFLIELIKNLRDDGQDLKVRGMVSITRLQEDAVLPPR
jgi:hypothetical protein